MSQRAKFLKLKNSKVELKDETITVITGDGQSSFLIVECPRCIALLGLEKKFVTKDSTFTCPYCNFKILI